MGESAQLMTYQVGGSLVQQAPSYVTRQSDTTLYESLKAGDFCYVLNARQMGKSSLLVRTKHRLQAEGYHCSVIDITNIGSENITPLQWYKGLISDLWRGFRLFKKFPLKQWKEAESEFSLLQQLGHFLEDVLLTQFPDENLVIFVDEIDSILSLPFPVDDFFALIRFCYNQRAINPIYNRLTFAIFGVATPSDLIRDRSRTPFNIGRPVDLAGFTLAEARPLAQGLTLEQGNPDAVLKAILDWTQGQLFLTQKLCQLVVDYIQKAANGFTVPPGNEDYWVETVVRDRLIKNWESNDEPEHLRTIRNRILYNVDKSGRLLGIYQQVLQGERALAPLGRPSQRPDQGPSPSASSGTGSREAVSAFCIPHSASGAVEADDSLEQTDLILSGLVVKQAGYLRVKNRIYGEVFNLAWVEQQLGSLRPYSQLLADWDRSGRTDESRLLRGQALRDAQAWAQGKQLSDEDYQFLAASVDCDRNVVQQTMEAEQLQVQLQQEQKNTKLQRRFLGAVTVGLLTAVGFGCFTLWQSRQVRISEIQALAAAAEGSFDSHRELEALHQVIQANVSLQAFFRPPQVLSERVRQVLQRIIYGTDAINRLELGAGVRSIAIDPTGELVAVVTVAGRLTFWHPDGRQVDVPIAPKGLVNDVAFHPDGKLIGIALENQTIELWQPDGTLVKTLTELPNNLHDLQFSLDGQQLIFTGGERIGYIFDLDRTVIKSLPNTLRLFYSPQGDVILATHPRPPDVIRQVKGMPPMSARAVRSNSEGVVGKPGGGRPPHLADSNVSEQYPTLSDVPNLTLLDPKGKPLNSFVAFGGPIFTAALSPDGQFIALARVDGDVELWTREGQWTKTFFGHRTQVRSIAFSPDGTLMATGGVDQTIKLWHADGTLISTFSGHQAVIRHLQFSPEGDWLVSASDDGTVMFWNPYQPLQEILAAHTDMVVDLAFTSDSQQLFSFSVDQRMNIWQRRNDRSFYSIPAKSVETPLSPLGSLIMSDGQIIAKFLRGGGIELIDTNGESLQTLQTGAVDGGAFSSDNQRLITGGKDRLVKVWQQQANGLFATVPSQVWSGHQASITAVALSPDDTLVATGSEDHVINLWHNNGDLIQTLTGHHAEIKDLAFSPDGAWFASASADNTIKLWRPDGTLVKTLTDHSATVRSLAFSPDSQQLVSGSTDRTVRLWQLDQPNPLLRTLTGHQGYVAAVDFSPDGTLIASTGSDRRVILWRINEILQVDELAYACDWAEDYLKHNAGVEARDRDLCELR